MLSLFLYGVILGRKRETNIIGQIKPDHIRTVYMIIISRENIHTGVTVKTKYGCSIERRAMEGSNGGSGKVSQT